MLAKVKQSLRLTGDTFNSELNDMILAAKADLGVAGVAAADTDPLIIRAVVTYCRLNFGQPTDYDRLKKSYDEQKAQLGMASGYTAW